MLSAAFLFLTCEVAVGALRPLDLAVAAAFQAIWWPPLWPLFEAIAVTGGIEVTTIVAAAVFLYLVWRRLWWASITLLAFPVGLVLEAVTKLFVHQPQPPDTRAGRLSVTTLIQGPANSYPSGHVLRAIIVYGLVALLLYRMSSARRLRLAVTAATALLIVAIGFDRLYLNVHWASDLLGGFLLGGICLWLAVLWLAASRQASHILAPRIFGTVTSRHRSEAQDGRGRPAL